MWHGMVWWRWRTHIHLPFEKVCLEWSADLFAFNNGLEAKWRMWSSRGSKENSWHSACCDFQPVFYRADLLWKDFGRWQENYVLLEFCIQSSGMSYALPWGSYDAPREASFFLGPPLSLRTVVSNCFWRRQSNLSIPGLFPKWSHVKYLNAFILRWIPTQKQ